MPGSHTPYGSRDREKAASRLRSLTRGAVIAATGVTVAIGIAASREHSGGGTTGTAGADERVHRFGLGLDHVHDGVGFGRLLLVDVEHVRIVVDILFEQRRQRDSHHDCAECEPEHAVGDVGRYVTMTSTTASSDQLLTARSFRAIGTTATVVVRDPAVADTAERELAAELASIDAACSRFREDSELQRVHRESGRPVQVGDVLYEALEVAVKAAARTGGAVDPTVGNALDALGYDADLDEVLSRDAAPPRSLGSVVGYAHVQLNPADRSVRIPRGVRLDLGSTAKALAADRAAARVARAVDGGALVSLGGDVAVAGSAPVDGWSIGIARESSTPAALVDQVVAIAQGGLASSATSARVWHAGGRDVHHIVDPRTGDSAEPYWTLVSATGASCVDANIVTTAAVVWGEEALDRLAGFDQSVRLVRSDGEVFVLNGWPLGGTT